MESRRQTKKSVIGEVASGKQRRKERKAELADLPAPERRAAKSADRAEAKAAKAERRSERKAMARPQRRVAKRRDRMYRKIWHRPRRVTVWTAVVLVVVLAVTLAAPYVRDISRVMAIELDSSGPQAQAARDHGAVVAEEISDEGIVLLTNDDDLLPLEDGGVNVFGFASFNMRYGGGGSGGADQSRAVGFYDGLSAAGIEYNEDLHAFMESQGASEEVAGGGGLMDIVRSILGGDDPDEPEIDYLTDEAIAQAKEFSDVALVVMGNDGVEMQDFTAEQLQITDNQRDLLDAVTGAFEEVVLVVNSGNAMELGFLEEYPQITSALWIGTPGPMGSVSLGNILAGQVNPSGRLTDTYAYDVTSAPAAQNFGDYSYDNANRALLNYEEGIYVGYRYYETRYADDDAGYDEAVQFPFGHGLSYTTFDRDVAQFDADEQTIQVQVEVTNTGDVTGKDVVQVYFSPPWTEGGIEKSAIELAGYAKTSLLDPGEAETVTVQFPVRDMASYDSDDLQGYVLEAGDYEIQVGSDVRSADATFSHEVPSEVVYDTDETTGTPLTNRFEDADGGLTYLSRSDWEGTWPSDADTDLTASPELLEAMAPEAEPTPAQGEAPTTGADHGIELADLHGLDFDDPAWEDFLDQFTLEELMELFSRGAYQTQGVERLGVPEATLLDGPAGLNLFFGELTAMSYPTQVVLASTWNDDLAHRMGEAVGAEANAYGVQGWYAPGMNLHRTAQGGRNFEYFSEDPLLSGTMGAAMVAGAQSQDVVVFMKHFVLNDQEVNARSGINIWVDEQAMRELYLRPFEITVKEADVTGAMSSFVHLGPTWAGGSPELLQDVLRQEWGFQGVVSTDAVLGGFMDNTQAVRHGGDLMLDVFMATGNISDLQDAYDQDPVGIGQGLRDSAHNLSYALLQTPLFPEGG